MKRSLDDFLSLEAIYFQNKDNFGEKAERIISNIYNEIRGKKFKSNADLINASKNVKALENLIRERFNLNLLFSPSLSEELCTFAILMPEPSFLDEAIKPLSKSSYNKIIKYLNDVRAFIKKSENKKGSIDLKNARVSGYLSKIPAYLIIDFINAEGFYALTEKELLAIMLHEIGHMFTFLEYHYRLEKTNILMLTLAESVLDNNFEKVEYICKYKFDEKEFKKYIEDTKRTRFDYYSAIIYLFLKEMKTQLINSKYDQTNSESLADSFATRFNYGANIVTALDKLHKTLDMNYSEYLSYMIFMYIFEISLILSFFSLGLGAVVIYIGFIVLFGGDYTDNTYLTYDRILDRYNRIRLTIIQNLKNSNLDEKMLSRLLRDLERVDEIMNSRYAKLSISDYIANFVLPSGRYNSAFIQLQQDIEKGLANNLFVSAAKVKVV